MLVDPASVLVGALAALLVVWLYNRLLARRTPNQPETFSESVQCEVCQRSFNSREDAVDHAMEVHKAPSLDDARACVRVVD